MSGGDFVFSCKDPSPIFTCLMHTPQSNLSSYTLNLHQTHPNFKKSIHQTSEELWGEKKVKLGLLLFKGLNLFALSDVVMYSMCDVQYIHLDNFMSSF